MGNNFRFGVSVVSSHPIPPYKNYKFRAPVHACRHTFDAPPTAGVHTFKHAGRMRTLTIASRDSHVLVVPAMLRLIMFSLEGDSHPHLKESDYICVPTDPPRPALCELAAPHKERMPSIPSPCWQGQASFAALVHALIPHARLNQGVYNITDCRF